MRKAVLLALDQLVQLRLGCTPARIRIGHGFDRNPREAIEQNALLRPGRSWSGFQSGA